jgi:hypothetical protein
MTWIRIFTFNGHWTVAHRFGRGRSVCGTWPPLIAEEKREGRPPRGWAKCKRCLGGGK